MKRFWKLMRNLLVIVVCAYLLWCVRGKPLNLTASYNRALRSHFIEDPPSTLTVWPRDGRVLAKKGDILYLYQQDGWFVADESIQTFPIRDGMGYAMHRNPGMENPLTFYAYEESGKASSARLVYEITCEEGQLLRLECSGRQEGNVFTFPLEMEPDGYTETGNPYYDGNRQEYITDIYEVYQGFDIWSEYALTITFYDDAGAVIGEISERA